MKVSTYGQIGGAFICFTLLGILWLIVPYSLFKIKKCTVLPDLLLASHIKSELVEFVESSCINRAFYAISLKNIQQKFPIVARVDGSFEHDGLFHCLLKTARPLLRINDAYVLMDDESVHPIDNFSENSIAHLPALLIGHEHTTEFSSECKGCLKRLPMRLFKQFSLTWVDHTRIYLNDTLTPNIVAVVDSQSIFDDRLVDKYEKIKKEIMQQRFFAKKPWTVDLRFKNQGIVAQKKVEEDL